MTQLNSGGNTIPEDLNRGLVAGGTRGKMSGKIALDPSFRDHNEIRNFMAITSRKTGSDRDESRPRAVTLEDIAKVAGVTAMTVSRVVKGKSNVSPETRELVLRIAQELNYTANLSARALKTGRTGTIAIISGSLNMPYSANIVCLLDEQLHASGHQMKLLHTQSEIGSLIGAINSAAVDGTIVAGMHGMVEEFSDKNPQAFQPCVHIGITKPKNADYVFCNLAPAVESATQRMIDNGRKRIAFVGVGVPGLTLSVQDTEVRTRAYLNTMEKARREPELISASDTYDVTGRERVDIFKQYLQTHGCPDGIVCVNDDITIQLYRALMDLGIKVPDDVALVGCDGLPVLEYFEPPLSTIAQPMEEMCALAWKFLQARINEPDLPPQHAEFDAQLVVRRSLQN